MEVAAQEGACYLDLGMTDEAAEALLKALDGLEAQAPHRIRDRVHYLSRLAKCYLQARDVEHACEIATQAVELSNVIGSARVGERLREFDDALQPFDNNKAAHEFRDLFATASAHRKVAT